MIKEILICYSLMNMNGVVNQENICDNVESLHKITKEYKIKPELYVSVLWVESNFKTNIKSYTGRACGISQVIPKYTEPKYTCKELNSNHVAAMEQGARIYSLFKPYAKGNDKMNLCAYNQGYRCKGEKPPKNPGDFDPEKAGKVYASKVIKFRKRLRRKIKKQRKKIKLYESKLLRALSSFMVYNKP